MRGTIVQQYVNYEYWYQGHITPTYVGRQHCQQLDRIAHYWNLSYLTASHNLRSEIHHCLCAPAVNATIDTANQYFDQHI